MAFLRRAVIRRRTAEQGRFTLLADKPIVLEGYDDLEVVGESFHQDNLWHLAGGRSDPARRVCKSIVAVLTPEPDNPYDSAAVAAYIGGLKVGHLSREDARLYGPGLLALLKKYGRPVALEGEIVGGGIRDDGPGMLGVFLGVNRADFGMERRTTSPGQIGIRTGRSSALAAHPSNASNDLSRLSNLPNTDVSAIPALRQLLAKETDPVRRHFIYASIESRLYRCRDVFASALAEFDEICAQHDAEMDDICHALMAEFGSLPLLELYRQMTIRKQKAHDHQAALRWAERGIALYSGRTATSDAVADLRHRAATYRAKLGSRQSR